MTRPVTLGQYLPGKSPIHRLDPRVKIILSLVYIVAIFHLEAVTSYLPYAALILLVVGLGHLPFRRLLSGLKALWVLILITFLFNIFTIPGHILWQWKFLTLTREGIDRAIFLALRVVLLVMATSLLTLTTSPRELTRGLESLLKPLKVFHFPASQVALMVSVALGFIPVLYQEADRIRRAQMARGADFEADSLKERAQASLPLLVPLFVNAMKRAGELSAAMEARCYRDGEGRTELYPLKMRGQDWAVLVFGAAALICGAVYL